MMKGEKKKNYERLERARKGSRLEDNLLYWGRE